MDSGKAELDRGEFRANFHQLFPESSPSNPSVETMSEIEHN
jgi:hypothetical protein